MGWWVHASWGDKVAGNCHLKVAELRHRISSKTSQTPVLAETSNINIFRIIQYFRVKSYKRNQWNVPNILAKFYDIFHVVRYIRRLFALCDNPFKRGRRHHQKRDGSPFITQHK